jgi:chlorobactene glucosyltransferase
MLTTLTVLVSLSLLFWVFALFAAAEGYDKEPRLHPTSFPPPPGEETPLVSVIVPARDEEQRVGNCLKAVLDQDYPRFEVILVDDRSSDRTAEIAEALAREDRRVRLVRGKPLPPGWAGKCHAIHQGVEAARGSWLLMLDTDTYLRPGCLSATMRDAVDRKADLYTLLFEAQCQSFWEKVVQPFFFQLLLLAMPIHKINNPSGREAAAPGPYLLFRRSAYEAIGGHAGMKDEVVEDLRLAQKIKQAGFRLYIANAVSLVYSRRRIGLREIWHGWSRVFYTGMEKNPFVAGAVFLGMVLFLLLPWLVVPWALAGLFLGSDPLGWFSLFALASVHCLLFMALRRLLFVFYRIDDSFSWLQPLAVLVALAILVNSVLTAGGSRTVVWRGRRY